MEEPILVTNQKENVIDQSEPDDFHVENEPSVDTGQQIESKEVEMKDVKEIEPSIEKKESEMNIPMDMDYTTAIMEDDLEAFDAIRKLFKIIHLIPDIQFVFPQLRLLKDREMIPTLIQSKCYFSRGHTVKTKSQFSNTSVKKMKILTLMSFGTFGYKLSFV